MKRLIVTMIMSIMLLTACEKEEGPEQCWHCYTYTKMWQTETTLSGEIISRKEVWFPTSTTVYCESDGYSQEIIERRIEMISEKKKVICYP